MYLLDHPAVLFVVACVVLLVAHEIGFRLRMFAPNREDKAWEKQVHDTRNQIALLLSLLIGFTLSMALGRFDERKKLVIDEANAIGTAYLRATMQAEPVRTQAPTLLREYVQSRISAFGAAVEDGERDASFKRSKQIQDELWSGVVTLAQTNQSPVVVSYSQSLNEMIDLDGERVAAVLNRIPFDIWLLMGILAIMTSVVVGYGQRSRAAMSTFIPVLMIAIAVSLIADLDTPTSGFIRVNQQSLQSLSADLSMNQTAGDAN